MPVLYRYRLYCETEEKYVFWWIPEDDPAPTTCPNNSSHTVVGPAVRVDQAGSVQEYTDEGEAKVVSDTPPGSEYYAFAWNYCDESEWVEGAVLVDGHEMRDTGDLTTWDTRPSAGAPPAHVNLIDIVTGRIMFQDSRFYRYTLDGSRGVVMDGTDPDDLGDYADYVPVVQVLPNGQADLPENWATKTYGTDYGINFHDAEVIFTLALTSGDRVKLTCRKSSGTYQFSIVPPAGKMLKVKYAEAHGMNYTMKGWVSREVTVPYGEGRVIVPGTHQRYYRLIHLGLDCTGAWPNLPAQGGSDAIDPNNPELIRGFGSDDLSQIPFKFLVIADPLRSSQDAHYVVRLEKAWEGKFANIVLYCTIWDEA